MDIQYNHSTNVQVNPQQEIFEFYSKDRLEKVGELVCHKTNMEFRPDYKGSTLAIDYLEATSRNRGLGTDMMRLAHQYSKQLGCGGYLVLKADSSINPERVPHVFYRRMGFSTQNKKLDKKLDKFISMNQSATFKDFETMMMVYPPVHENNQGILKRLFKGALKIFRK